jgi:hypothetical protein
LFKTYKIILINVTNLYYSDFTKWTRHYVLSVYDPKTYEIKYTEVVPLPTISLFYIKDAVRVAKVKFNHDLKTFRLAIHNR